MDLSTLLTLFISMVTVVWRYPPRMVWMPRIANIQAPDFPSLAGPPPFVANTTVYSRPATDLVVQSRVDLSPSSAAPSVLFCFGLVCLVLFLRLRTLKQHIDEQRVATSPVRKLVLFDRATQTPAPVTSPPAPFPPPPRPSPELGFSSVMHTVFRAIAPSYLSADQVRAQVTSHEFRVLDLEIDLGRKQTELNEALYKIRQLEKHLKKNNIRYESDSYFSDSDEAHSETEMLRKQVAARRAHESISCKVCHRSFKGPLPDVCYICVGRRPKEVTFTSAVKELETQRYRMWKKRREELFAGPSPTPTPEAPAPVVAPPPRVATPLLRNLPGRFETTPGTEPRSKSFPF